MCGRVLYACALAPVRLNRKLLMVTLLCVQLTIVSLSETSKNVQRTYNRTTAVCKLNYCCYCCMSWYVCRCMYICTAVGHVPSCKCQRRSIFLWNAAVEHYTAYRAPCWLSSCRRWIAYQKRSTQQRLTPPTSWFPLTRVLDRFSEGRHGRKEVRGQPLLFRQLLVQG